MVEKYFGTYDDWKEDISKYFPPAWVNEIIHAKGYSTQTIGKSVEGRPIHLMKIGTGPRKILLWAQMHGNETTAARAMFDVWNVLHDATSSMYKLLDEVEIHLIPQLNPDGAQAYTRENADGLDINRDFNQLKTPEMRALRNLVDNNTYDVLFNLHDQRTIFHPYGKKVPATLSFLAPVVDDIQTIPENRSTAMKIIGEMARTLDAYIPDQIARFSDEYYPEATGDNFQRIGIPTILVECGHYPNDYQREMTRKFTFIALLKAIEVVAMNNYNQLTEEIYHKLPENDDKAFDMIYHNVIVKEGEDEKKVDIAIHYKEKLVDDEIKLFAEIELVGNLEGYFGHDNCHAENRVFLNESGNYPIIGQKANFNLSEWKIRNGKIVS